LVTYAKADLTKIPTRESFAEAVVAEFNHGQSVVKVIHWACCQESHQDDSKHYHLSQAKRGKAMGVCEAACYRKAWSDLELQ